MVPNRWWRLITVLGVLAGVGLRIWMLAHPQGRMDSDEAVVGLMARHLLDGEWTTFYWGQHYAGSQEAVLAAGVFAVTGSSVLALKAVPLALSAVAAVLVWRIGRRVIGEEPAIVAGLAFWVWPAAYVWWSAHERGFYWVCLVCGLAILLLATRLAERPSVRDWALLGFAAGFGWWASPHVVFYAVPAAIWLLGWHRNALRGCWAAVPTALLGAAPWLWHNVERGWPSLESPPQPVHEPYLERLRIFLWEMVPMALNLRQPFSHDWPAPVVTPIVYLLIVGVLGAALVRWRREALLLVIAVGAFPFVYAAFPTAWYVGEGRYGVFLAPYLALLVGLACRPLVRRPSVVVAVLVGLFAASAYSVSKIGIPPPVRVDDDLRVLEAAGVDHVWADYWVAYRLTFESQERLIASPIFNRRQSYADAVAGDPEAGYLFLHGEDDAFRDELRRLGLEAREIRTGDFVVFVPDRAVQPNELVARAWP